MVVIVLSKKIEISIIEMNKQNKEKLTMGPLANDCIVVWVVIVTGFETRAGHG